METKNAFSPFHHTLKLRRCAAPPDSRAPHTHTHAMLRRVLAETLTRATAQVRVCAAAREAGAMRRARRRRRAGGALSFTISSPPSRLSFLPPSQAHRLESSAASTAARAYATQQVWVDRSARSADVRFAWREWGRPILSPFRLSSRPHAPTPGPPFPDDGPRRPELSPGRGDGAGQGRVHPGRGGEKEEEERGGARRGALDLLSLHSFPFTPPPLFSLSRSASTTAPTRSRATCSPSMGRPASWTRPLPKRDSRASPRARRFRVYGRSANS